VSSVYLILPRNAGADDKWITHGVDLGKCHVVLCGGLGTRLREETEFRPKPLVEIGGRPIL